MNSTIVPAGIRNMPSYLVGKQLIEVKTITYRISGVTHTHVSYLDRADGKLYDMCIPRDHDNASTIAAVTKYAKTTSANVCRGTSNS